MDNFKVDVRVAERGLTVEGTADFVNATLESWKDFLIDVKNVNSSVSSEASAKYAAPEPSKQAVNGHTQFDNVFDSADDKLKIIATIPGKNKAELTRNTALVLLYGKLLDGSESIPSELIREACSYQGCYDSNNFAQYVKALKNRVVMNTKQGGGYDIKLTAPGRKEALELVEKLQAGT